MMSAAERLRRMLETPGGWLAFTAAEVIVTGWLIALALPGDPSTYPLWIRIAVFVAWVVGMTAANVKLRHALFGRWP